MHDSEFFLLGKILRPHGIGGKVKVLVCADPALFSLSSVYLAHQGTPKAYKVHGVQSNGRIIFLQLDGIDSIDKAKPLQDMCLYIPRTHILSSPEGTYYLHELIGMQLYDDKVLVGEVTQCYAHGLNPLIGVSTKTDDEVLIPAHRDLLLQVDKKEKKIHAQLPTGLIAY